jgi:H+/Cl- antiporter ClcA
VVFNLTIHELHDITWGKMDLYGASALDWRGKYVASLPLVLLVPVAGGVGVSALRWWMGDFDTVEQKAVKGRNRPPWMAPIARAACAALTLGTGNSLGPEGPAVDIGTSIANALTQWRGRYWSKTSKLALVASGSSAGVAAGFNASIAGVFFAMEAVLKRAARVSEGNVRVLLPSPPFTFFPTTLLMRH